MKSLLKYLMIVLSYSPIVSVAVAAQAKASEIEGEGQNEILWKELQGARSRVLALGQTQATHDQVISYYQAVTGLSGVAMQVGLKRDLDFLTNNGVIKINEKDVVSHGPSQYQAP